VNSHFRGFTLVHLAHCAAAIFLRDAADIVRFGFADSPLTLPACSLSGSDPLPVSRADLSLPVSPAKDTSERSKRSVHSR
jgi:hypothetical protein